MSQLRHPVSTCATCAVQWKMWLFKVFGVIYMVAVCASEDNDATTYSYSTAPPPFVPPVPVLVRTSSWSDVFSSEKVVLECKATSSSELIFTWKKNGSPLGSGPNLSLSPDKSVLTITSASPQDSGNYTCVVEGKKKPSQTKESGPVSIQVYASKPKPTLTRDSDFGEMFPGESITFTCSVDVSSGWEYLWYHGQNQISGVNSNTYTINSVTTQNSGKYYCEGKRGQFFTDPSESTTLNVIDPPTPDLPLQTPQKDVFENEAVEFRCQVVSSSPGWTFTWHRNNQQLQNNSDEIINGDGSSLKITSVRQMHKGSYTCKAHLTSRGVNSGFSSEVMIQVREIPVPTITETPKWTHVFPTESVKFKCGIGPDSYNWIYTWYRDGKQVNADGTVSFDTNRAGLSISSASAGHTGKYKCSGKIQNRAVTSQTSSEFSLTVYAQKPTLTLTRDPDYDVMFAGEAVTFSCAISVQSEWTYLWYKDGSEVTGSSDKLAVQIKGTGNGGSYTCKATRGPNPAFITDSSAPEQLNVQEIPVPTITETPKWTHVFPTESVKFKCGIGPDSYNWIYTWYRDGTQVIADGTVSFDTNGAGLSISSASAGHTGKYNCSGKIQNSAVTSQTSSEVSLTVYAEKPTLKLTRDPDYDVMFAGESVTFSCAINVPSEWTYLWYKDGSEVTGSSDKLVVQISGTADGGSYTCNATRGQNPAFTTDSSVPKQLKVQENKPKPSITQQPDAKKLYVGENVSFECKVENSDGWSYDWYKDGASILTNSNSLKMERLDLSKGGAYKCKAKRDKTGFNTEFSDQRTLQISEIPVPTLKLVTKWPDVFPTENVNMRCEMQTDSADWTYAFYRDGTKVQDYNSATDTRSLSITSASASDRGNYSCSGKLKIRDVYSITSSPLKLNVYAQKPTLTLTRDPEYDVMFAGEAVTFSCAISVPSEWKYLWYKDNSQVTGSSDKLTVQINGTADGGSYTCKATRGQNPAFITDSSGAKQLKVQAQKPNLTLTRDPEYNVMFAGEAVTFSCAISVQSEWTYLWYKDGNQITESSDKLVVQIRGTADGGSYTCKATRGQNPTFITDLSGAKQLKVQAEKPTLTLTRDPNYDVMFAGESVNFSCAISVHSEWKYLWYKDGSQVTGSSDKLTVQINGTADGGSYTCKATRGQNPAFITDLSAAKQLKVQDAKPTVTLEQNPAHNLMHSEDSVSFNCHVNVSSGWEYLWYKDDKELVLPGNNYNITSVTTKDSGSYKCKVSRGTEISKLSNIVKLKVEERPKASIVLLTGWSDVFSTDSLILLCEVKESTHNWTHYTWLKEEGKIDSFSEKHAVTPSNDPDQSTYTCRAHADERPLYSKSSDSFKTKNLLLKRRVLLSISGCIVFGIAAVFIGCVALRVFRKPNGRDDKMEEVNLFPTMAELKITDVPCPLVEYITDASLNAPAKEEEEENGTVCNETTPLPITKQEDQAATTDNQETTETNGGLSSFLK